MIYMTRLLEEDNKYRLILILLISFFVVAIVLFILFSKIEFKDKVNGTVATVLNEGELIVNYVDGDEIAFNDSDEHTYGITITNSSNDKVYYSIYFSKSNISDINVSIKDKDSNILNTLSSNIDTNKLLNLYSIDGGETVRYFVVIDSDTKVNFKGTLKVDNDSMNTEMFADLILLNNEIGVSKTNIGSEVATTNEGLLSTIDNKGTTYFFRGNVNNNYVKIGDLLFRIVRINGDSTVRLILDGVLKEQYAYNSNELDDDASISSLSLLSNSSILTKLNSWIETNLSSYSKYLVNGDFCTDTSFNLNVNGINYSNTYERIFNDGAPDLYCSGTVYSSKVGLISVDEVVFAGAAGSKPNTSYYLYNKNIPGNYLTNSTYFINVANNVAMMNIMSNGAVGDGILITNQSYIRPVINIGTNANVKGNGTLENPYMIVS